MTNPNGLPQAQARVVVGMSGGVDSSVAALLLLREGYQVSGLFMKNWEEDDPQFPCTAKQDALDALQVCDTLGIALDAVSFAAEYRERVFQYFLDEHRRGRTPNPDVLCNTEIKFKAFLDHALDQGAELIATGHYARVAYRDGAYRLLKALDGSKDQSYFLHGLSQKQLSRAVFPLGELPKAEVRRIAAQARFANHAKKDSTGICFIGERNFRRFLTRYLGAQPGDIRSTAGERLGAHHGLMYYTLGQRQGLGIGGRAGDSGEPWFVVDKDITNNTLVVAQGGDHPQLYSRALSAAQLHWIADEPMLPLRCRAKTRYRQPDQPCLVERRSDGGYRISFEAPQRAVTPGQYAVLYQNDECLGGGIIDTLIR
jgi:tRNA-specific 2-thiouridylase